MWARLHRCNQEAALGTCNYCDIATGRETGHEVLVCGTGTEATGKDESSGHPYISEKYVPAVQNRQDNRIQGLQRAYRGTCTGIDLQS